MRQAIIVVTLLMLMTLPSGCSYETRIVSPSPPAPSAVVSLGEPLHTLAIEDVEFTRKGKPANVDVGVVQRLASDLRKSGLFRTVYDPANSYNAPKEAVRIKLTVSDTLDKQWGERLGKDFLVGSSYLILAPIVPYTMEYDVAMRATVTLPDESTMEFESVSKAEVKYKHLSDRFEAEEELQRAGMNDCLNNLVAQMKSNEKFLSALKPE
ncbi:MAG: hypothetical protein ACREQ3_02795 [Candidatus Binatia bacterium]